MALNITATGGKQIGGWYNHPRTGENQRYWGTIGNQEIWTSNPNLSQEQVYASVSKQMGSSTPIKPSYSTMSPDQIIAQTMKATQDLYDKQLATADKRAREFDENNPFSFDEAQAKASAKAVFDPGFDADLSEYVEGITRQKERTVEDEERVRREITSDLDTYIGRAKRDIMDALDSAKEGFAGVGLYASGKRLRSEGRIETEGNEQIRDRQLLSRRNLDQNALSRERTLTDLDAQQAGFTRRLEDDRTRTIETDVASQRQQALQRRDFERSQYLGGDFARMSLNNLFGS